jgi:hypothetical protein
MQGNSAIPSELLEAPFPTELIKTRPGAFGGSLSYIEGHTIIARLNEAFGGCWSFEIVTHQVMDEEVLVLAKFRADQAGVVKMSFGSSRITRDQKTGNAIALGDDLKAAATDALKKAATLLGVGLYLYSGNDSGEGRGDRPFDEDLRTTPPRRGDGQPRAAQSSRNNRGNGEGRVTSRQLGAIFAISRERGMSNADVRALSKEMFVRLPDYLSKADASQLIQHLLDQ